MRINFLFHCGRPNPISGLTCRADVVMEALERTYKPILGYIDRVSQSLSMVSHVVEEFSRDNDQILLVCQTLDTPDGRRLYDMYLDCEAFDNALVNGDASVHTHLCERISHVVRLTTDVREPILERCSERKLALIEEIRSVNMTDRQVNAVHELLMGIRA